MEQKRYYLDLQLRNSVRPVRHRPPVYQRNWKLIIAYSVFFVAAVAGTIYVLMER